MHNLPSQIKTIIIFNLVAIAIGVILFGIWGGLAPLDSAAIAEGYIAINGNHKVIQHVEGGLIDKVLVQEGDLVQRNQLLVALKDTAIKSRIKKITRQLAKEKATKQRLLAEEQGSKFIRFARDTFTDCDITEIRKIQEIQEKLFKSHQEELTVESNTLRNQAAQGLNQVKNLEKRLQSIKKQLAVLSKKLALTQKSYAENPINEQQIWGLKKNINDLQLDQSELESRLYITNKELESVKLKILELQHKTQRTLYSEIQETQNHIVDMQEQLNTAKETLKRLTIRAPITGIVTDLRYHIEGETVTAKSKIMDLVPQQGQFIVETRVQPKDIENIKIGTLVRIQLNAYKSRLVPRLTGTVIYISPDHILDEITKTYCYLIRIQISDTELKNLKYNVKLYLGMPVTVFIVKGSRTVLQYLISPITESFWKAFKEQ